MQSIMQFFTDEEMGEFQHEQCANLRRYWLRNYADNYERIIKEYDIRGLPDLKFSKPIVVIGGADIAAETLEMLAEMKVTAVCCDKALPKVLPYFRPQYVTAVNTQKTNDVELEKWFADTEGMNLIVPVTVHPDTVKLWKGNVFWTNPTNIDEDLVMKIQQETGIPGWHRGLNVGEFSLAMAAFMRPAEIGLFGLWYCWKTRGEVVDFADPQNYNVVELCQNGIPWFTNITWLSSRSIFIDFCKKLYTQGIPVFNCSQGGMLYHDDYCKPMDPENFVGRWSDEGPLIPMETVPHEEEEE